MLSKEEKKIFDEKIKAEKQARAAALKKVRDDVDAAKERGKKVSLSEIPILEAYLQKIDSLMKEEGADLSDLKKKKEKTEDKLARFKKLK